MKYTRESVLFLLWSWLLFPAYCQYYMAELNENTSLEIHRIEGGLRTTGESKSAIHMMEGFPVSFIADPAFKNFRNLTLADLDSDGADEIIAGINDQIYAMKNNSIAWTNKVVGIIRFPVSIGDIDNNGEPDIVCLSGYVGNEGRVNAFDRFGQILEGWPSLQAKKWMLSSAGLADLNNDGYLEVVCADRDASGGQVYAFRYDGTLLEGQWPVHVPNTPAVTPSIGDVDQDGFKDVVICSTQEIFLFDRFGNSFPGWPIRLDGTRFSYQSPILADLDKNGTLEIIGAGHGDNPIFYAISSKGMFMPSWPKPVPGGSWTFCPPTVVYVEKEYRILVGRPIGTNVEDMLYGWDETGSDLPNFPLVKAGGVEGVITIANVDSDENPELVFPSNLLTADGHGFIHAYEFDGSGELPGFPLLVKGWTFLNGGCIGDVNGDGQSDLVVLSYTEYPGQTKDTAFISVFELEIPYIKEQNLWPTYKGNNRRDGMAAMSGVSTSFLFDLEKKIFVYPNPTNEKLYFSFDDAQNCELFIYELTGKKVFHFKIEPGTKMVNITGLNSGTYIYCIRHVGKIYSGKLVKM